LLHQSDGWLRSDDERILGNECCIPVIEARMQESKTTFPARASRSFARRHIILLALGVLSIFLIGLYLYHLHSTELQFQTAIAEASAANPNWRLVDLEAHRREVPDAENGMVRAMAALSLLPTPWPIWDHVPANETAEDRQARDALSSSFWDLEPPAQLSDLQIKALRTELHRASRTVQDGRKLIDVPCGIQRLNWTKDFFSTLLPNTQKVRQLANVLDYDILLQVQDRDFAQALRSARALLNTGRSIGDEPTLVSQLVRIAIDGQTFSKIEPNPAPITGGSLSA
jgi:hypothetical protein